MITSLDKLNVLALDCQTTGATPDKGRMLEIGWVETTASDIQGPNEPKVCAFLFKSHNQQELARPIQRITGITQDDLMDGLERGDVRQKLYRVVERVMAANQSAKCPTVIHFARFEKPFLHDFISGNDSSPNIYRPYGSIFQIICTHEIVRRLLPDLPRKGLRAVAGFFGYSLPERKRSADHARATAWIWRQLVSLLAQKQHIRTMDDLVVWMQSPPPAKSRNRAYPMDSGDKQRVPDQPGIYRMLRTNADVLYIGKAASLKKRVNSYFRPRSALSEHILEMLTQAYRLDFTVTDSALEAALLETDEIKNQSPPYNVALRRGRRRLVFTGQGFQRFVNTSDIHHPIGPLPSGPLTTAMTAFGSLLKSDFKNENPAFEATAGALLAIPKDYAPEKDCLHEGIGLFLDRYRHALKQKGPSHPLSVLTGLGARFWREQIEQRDQEEPGEADISTTEKPGAEEASNGWNPERVSQAIEHVIRKSAHLIRRARWFCLLSESSLAWTSPLAGDGRKFLLVLRKGSVTNRTSLDIKTRPPIPTGSYRRPLSRKQHMDLITYDRLRVLTTELRRLVVDGREIELRLRPTATLDRRRLSRALYWV